MRCPHLAKDVIYTCGSGEGPALPGSSALRKFCKDDRFRNCPLYMARARGDYCWSGMDTAA